MRFSKEFLLNLSMGILCSAIAIFAIYKIITSPGPHSVAAEFEVKLSNAIAESRTVKDPWTAFKMLDAAEAVILNSNDPFCPEGACLQPPSLKSAAERRVELLAAAIKSRNPAAFAFLYGNEGAATEYAQLRQSSVQALLDLADSASNTADLRPVLMRAANLFAKGNMVVHDTSKAVGYYARAWAAGEEAAANLAAQLFLDINDLRNTYLWSLRCTGHCTRNNSLQLNGLESALSPEAAKQAQRSAASPSVIELDTSGG